MVVSGPDSDSGYEPKRGPLPFTPLPTLSLSVPHHNEHINSLGKALKENLYIIHTIHLDFLHENKSVFFVAVVVQLCRRAIVGESAQLV